MLSTYKTILSQKTQLSSNVYLFHFNLKEPKEINFSAGQYLMIKIPTDECLISRLYSIASSSLEKNSFELIIKIIPGGLASSYLSDLKVKEAVVFQGPAGMFGLKENNRPKIFLATGTGIAPILSIIKSKFSPDLIGIQFSMNLFWGVKTYKDVYLFNELKSTFAKATVDKQFNFKICLSQEQNLKMIAKENRKYFEIGHVDECLIRQLADNFQNYDFYLCGRREIVESFKLLLINKGVLQENIMFEKF